MAIKFEIRAKTGEGKDGKAFYSRIGVIMETQKGLMAKFETVPVGWDGWAYLSEPKPKESAAAGRGTVAGEIDDDVPF